MMRNLVFGFFFLGSLGASETEKIKQADLLFDAAFYPEAGSLYQEVLGNLAPSETGSLPHTEVAYKLALALYQEANYQAVLNVLKEVAPTPKSLYLQALAYKYLKQHENSIEALHNYFVLEKDDPSHEGAKFELGYACFQLGRLEEARECFESLISLQDLKEIYLSRIEMAEEKWDVAKKRLDALALSLPLDHPLFFEVASLQGEIFFHRREYLAAAHSFEKAIPKRNCDLSDWSPRALYYLGWCYLKAAEENGDAALYDKAEAAFKKLVTIKKDETAYLALGHCYVAKGRKLHDEKSLQQANDILAQSKHFVTKDGQAQSLILRTEAAGSYSERDKLYHQLTLDSLRDSHLFALGWYLRGLNQFEEGQSLVKEHKDQESAIIFGQAIDSLKKASEYLLEKDPWRAALAQKYLAQAYLHVKNPESIAAARSLLEELMSKQTQLEDPDEVHYLYALSLENQAVPALKKQIESYPKGKFAPQALYLLGTLYYQQKDFAQAKAIFLDLAQQYASYAGEANFWCARCSQELQEEDAQTKSFLSQVFEQYPESTYAAEAYFTYYSYSDYLHGHPEALKHLKTMPEKYPCSPFLLNANYLIGIDYKKSRKNQEGKLIHRRNLIAAIDAFQDVESTFDLLHEQKLIPQDKLAYSINIR